MHESFARKETIAQGSDRAFGFVMAGAFALLAGLNAWHVGWLWPYLSAVSAGFFIAALIRPSALKSLNRLWFRFGLLLHGVVNPIVMGLLFFGAVVPTGMVMRLMKKDLLRLRHDRSAESYWIVRQPPGPQPEAMKDQF